MTIEIKITDPQLLDEGTIIRTAKYLLGLKDIGMQHFKFNQQKEPVIEQRPIEELMIQGLISKPPMLSQEQHDTLREVAKETWVSLPANTIESVKNPLTEDVGFVLPPEGLENIEDKDSAKMPWDARIHSRAKSKTSDGKWRYQRGIGDDVIKVVEAELVGKFKTLQERCPIPPLLDLTPPPLIKNPFAKSPTIIPPPLPDIIEEEFIDPRVPQDDNFQTLINMVTTVVSNGKLKSSDVLAIVKKHGVIGIPALATRPDLIPTVIKEIAAMVGN